MLMVKFDDVALKFDDLPMVAFYPPPSRRGRCAVQENGTLP
jgi:hypothetical protein